MYRISSPLDFGPIIRERRLALGMTQPELAEKSGIGKAFIGSIERGEKCPSVESAVGLFMALGLTLMVTT